MSLEAKENQIVDAIHTIHYSTGPGMPGKVYEGIVRSVMVEKRFELVDGGEVQGQLVYHVDDEIALLVLSDMNADLDELADKLTAYLEVAGLKAGVVFNFAAMNPTLGTRRARR
ncbi:hypothetical protein KS4_01550 [Poriferisphaera corsica]|uniref:GxxExxY protein n=1 Tax=Poriferisphaera corsica TaxID=2528020 RepID=A0A517YPI2_9BACT|nr:hypothetical protein [Poriferisphaera corsica]QDU32126.1 hypothetical protein KS4_01550 [Poriferisphaera corsica]